MRVKSFTLTHCTILVLALMSVMAEKSPASPDLGFMGVEAANMPYGYTFWTWDALVIGVTLGNGGNDSSGAYTVDYYLSQDTTITSGDYHLGTATGEDIRPYKERGFETTFLVPNDIPDGWYYIGAIVVCTGDSNPYNNVCYGMTRIRILTPVTNLGLQRVAAVGKCCRPGGPLKIATEVKNDGQKTSATYSVEYYLGTRKVGVASRGGLERGSVDAFTAEIMIPFDIPHGDYELMAKVICSDDISATNNEGYAPAKIWVGPFADVAVRLVNVADGTYVPGQQVVVHTVIENVGDKNSDKCIVSYYMSVDADITIKDQCIGHVARAALAPGARDTVDAICQLPSYSPQGSRFIGAIVACANDGSASNDQGLDDTPITLVHAARYVCGRITYKDMDSWEHPVRCARVKAYQADSNNNPLDDRVIGETSTDQDGNYGVLLPADGNTGGQIYIKAFTQAVAGAYVGTVSSICSVRDDVLKDVYLLKSPLYPYPRDASLTVSMTAQQAVGEFMVYDSVIEGFHKAWTFFGIEPNEITVYWPSSDNGTYYDPNTGIHIGKEDRGDRDVIMHEYGHYIARLGEFAQGAVGDRPMHYWRIDLRYSPSNRIEEHARNLAFREAWATLFSIATQYGDVSYSYSGDDKYQDYDETLRTRFVVDLERETRYHKQPGEFYENMNACALWDIFDDNCDGEDNQDTLSDRSLSKIWTVLLESRPEDIKDFWDGWFTKYAYAKELMRIFKDHGMSFKYTGPSTAVEGFETGDLKAFAWTCPDGQPWRIASDVRHQGAYSARTEAIGDSQKSVLEIRIKVDDGSIRFWRKVSTEEGFDKLQFFIDGSMMCEWSGEMDWRQVEFSVKSGTHTFTWKYVKNSSTSEGADTAWLDDIEFPIW